MALSTNGVVSFSEKVWLIVGDIPKGRVMSYGAVACRAGSPGAGRAVGSLMKKNLDASRPCHRVIRSDGTVGRYNRGEKRKCKLLSDEGVIIVNGRVREKI